LSLSVRRACGYCLVPEALSLFREPNFIRLVKLRKARFDRRAGRWGWLHWVYLQCVAVLYRAYWCSVGSIGR